MEHKVLLTREMVSDLAQLCKSVANKYALLGYMCGLAEYTIEAIKIDSLVCEGTLLCKLILTLQELCDNHVYLETLCAALRTLRDDALANKLSGYRSPRNRPEFYLRRKTYSHPCTVELQDAMKCYKSRWFSVAIFLGLQVDQAQVFTSLRCGDRMNAVLGAVRQDNLVARLAIVVNHLDLPLPVGVNWHFDSDAARSLESSSSSSSSVLSEEIADELNLDGES